MSSTADQLRQYASILWNDTDIIELRPVPPTNGIREWIKAAEIGDDARVERLLSANANGVNLFAGVLPRKAEGGGKSEDVDGGRVVWADFDHMTADEAIAITGKASFPIPSMAVATGHGAHLFWRLDKWEPKDRICAAVRGIIALFGCDKSTKDPARILRLPGFVNHKEPVASCEIVYADEFTSYELDDILAYLPEEEPIKSAPRTTSIAIPVVADNSNLDRARGYINKIPGSGEGGRTTTAFRVAAVLVNDYQLEDAHALPLLQGWDLMNNNPPIQHDPKYGEAEFVKIIANARKYHKKTAGEKLLPDVEINIPMVDNRSESASAPTEPVEKKQKRLTGRKALAPFMNPGGILQQICDYIDAGAYCVQPELSLAAAVAFFGAAIGRTVRDETNARTNLYIIGTAPSGSGKDRAISALSDIASAADMANLIGPSGYRSGSALLKTIAAHPQIISLIDEAGLFFRGVSIAGRTNAHATEIIRNILELYSRSGSIYTPPAAAGYDIAPINQPSLSIYGVTVPESLYDGLPKEAISNGFFARTLIVPGRERPEEREPYGVEVPDSLVAALRTWRDKARSIGNLTQENPKPIVVPFEQGVKEFYLERRRECKERGRKAGEPLATLWTRSVEIGKRIALVHACSLDCHAPTISLESARWGCGFAEAITAIMVQSIDENMVENEAERAHKRVMALIRQHPNGISKSDLTRKTQWLQNRRMRDDIIDTLVDSKEAIITDGTDKKGRPAMMIKATGA